MNNERVSITEKLVDNLKKIPKIEETQVKPYGPVMTLIRSRMLAIYGAVCIIALVPVILALCGVQVSPRIIACFLGLIMPGGGFIATARIGCIFIGLAIVFFCMKFGSIRNASAGDKSWVFIGWIVGALGGLCAKDNTVIMSVVLVCIAATCLWGYYVILEKRNHKILRKSREIREERFDEYIEEMELALKKATEPECIKKNELGLEELAAARTIFDVTTRNIGDISGFEFPKWCLNEFRYQMCYAGYGLMAMQHRYTPNFRGYLSHSLRYIIDSFTTPQACGYWKTEAIGGDANFDMDPISPKRHDNIMLKGWIAPIICGYEALTGDDRYNQPKALKFNPFYHKTNKTYDYSVEEIVKVIVEDWKSNSIGMIPCEPHLAFTICNAYPMIGILMYDNAHGTCYAEEVYDRYIQAQKFEMTDLNGSASIRRNTFLGVDCFPVNSYGITGIDYFAAPPLNALYPGYAKRSYAFARKELLGISEETGEAMYGGIPFRKAFKFENSRDNGPYMLGLYEMCATEFGDYEMLQAFQRTEKLAMQRTQNPLVLEYNNCELNAAFILATSRWAGKDDWYELAHFPATDAAKYGPVLDECKYPDVLVAKAYSSGEDLELVLYNGTVAGKQKITLAQLIPDREYIEKKSGKCIRADNSGHAEMEIMLDGRTELSFEPV